MQQMGLVDNDLSQVNPNMVILARESRGLSQKILAEQLGTTQERISKIEAGLRPVSDELLTGFVRILDYPAHFFFQEGSRIGIGITDVFHRKLQRVPAKTLNRIYAQIEVRIRHIAALLRAIDVPCKVPRFDIDDYEGRVDEIAQLVRANWHLPRGPIQNLTKVMEDAGILIIPMDFGVETREVDAISRWVPALPPLVFMNERSPKDRCRYSLAHELGHLVMHEKPTANIEDQADRFAGEFLLPQREIHADLVDASLPKLALLKRYWKVSMAALLHRAKDLDAITPSRARYLWAQMSKAGYNVREPVELDVHGEKPTLLREMIEAHLDELGYTGDELKEVLALSKREVRALYLGDEPNGRLKAIRAV